MSVLNPGKYVDSDIAVPQQLTLNLKKGTAVPIK